MNPYFAMNPNDNEEERQPNSFDVDDESDVYFLRQAYQYHETLVEDENRPMFTRNPVHRDREGAEDRLMDDYFDDIYILNEKGGPKEDECIMSYQSQGVCLGGSRNLLDDKAHVAPFMVNGVGYEKGYYLAYEIYPQWATFVKSFTVENDAKHSYFKKHQESARKDIERAFGVLQGRWGIIQQPSRQYHLNNIHRIMYSCIILHNMILEDQKMTVTDWNDVYANPSRNMQRA
nr:protein ALP1-like isoform X1 [Tanacetum cinerariifolium]